MANAFWAKALLFLQPAEVLRGDMGSGVGVWCGGQGVRRFIICPTASTTTSVGLIVVTTSILTGRWAGKDVTQETDHF